MDGLPKRNTLRKMRYATYRCAICERLFRKEPDKCPHCGATKFERTSLPAEEFCIAFGHKNAEALIPGSERVEHPVGSLFNGKRVKEPICSHKYRSYCSRCGREKTSWKIGNSTIRPEYS